MKRSILRPMLLVAVATVPPLLAAEAAGPELRPGKWRFERTFESADGRATGAPIVVESCGDPEESNREAVATLRKMGCGYERTQSGPNTWRQRLVCEKPGLPKGTSTSVMRVAGPEAYEVDVENEGEMAEPAAREHLKAKRLGDC